MSDPYRALADPTRRRILQLLSEQPMTAGDLAGHFPLAKATLSGHFTVLREAGLVTAERSGVTITYRADTAALRGALTALMDAFSLS